MRKAGAGMQTTLKNGLTGNQLKILALIFMTLDHIGAYLLPQILWLRIVGRLAMPIFAFMIAEGCRHTRSKVRYLAQMAAVAAVCQAAYWVVMGSVEQCIFVTFSLSQCLIFSVSWARERKRFLPWLCTAGVFFAVYYLCSVLPGRLPGTDFRIDYGIWGVLLPVFFYIGTSHWEKLLLGGIALVMLAQTAHSVQWWALAALPLLALYSGQRGKWRLKYLFYLYYPLHLAALYGVKLLIELWR